MKAFIRWLGRIIASVITLVLVIVLLPYASKLAAKWLPDESGAAIKASAILSSRMSESARLETLKVEEDGVLHYDIQAAFLGSVGTVNVSYRYEGSFGIDLSKVEMRVSGTEITFLLPSPELIQDALTPVETYRDDFWVPGFSDADYQQLLEDERAARRDVYLSGEESVRLWESTVAAMEKTVASWLTDVQAGLTFQYQPLDESGEE